MINNQCDLKCQNEGHENGSIIGVCTDPNCNNQRPFCLGCKFEFHSTHNNQLKKFEELNQWVSENSAITKNLQKLLNELNEIVISIEKVVETNTQTCHNSYFNQMSYTNLNNAINNLIKQWNTQKGMFQHLEQMMQSSVTQKIIQYIKSFQCNQQSAIINTQLNQQQQSLNYREIKISNNQKETQQIPQFKVQFGQNSSQEGIQFQFKQEQNVDKQNKPNLPKPNLPIKFQNIKLEVKQNDGIIRPIFFNNLQEGQEQTPSLSPFKKYPLQNQQPFNVQSNTARYSHNFQKSQNQFKQQQS